MFWWFIPGPFVILLLALFQGKEAQFVIVALGACFVSVAIPIIIGNAFPAIRISPDGVSIRFYFPFFSQWINVPWEHIGSIEAYVSVTDSNKFHPVRRPSLLIISDRLPLYYYVPMLLVGKHLRRGFLIMNNIRWYDILLKSFPQSLIRGVPWGNE